MSKDTGQQVDPIETNDMNDEEQFKKALDLRKRGQFADSQHILEGLCLKRQESAALFTVLGDVYMEQGNLDKALLSFSTATSLAPRSQEVSLGLFLALWKSGKVDSAFEEMKRYTELCGLGNYRETLDELTES